jgi:hypothetical protein
VRFEMFEALTTTSVEAHNLRQIVDERIFRDLRSLRVSSGEEVLTWHNLTNVVGLVAHFEARIGAKKRHVRWDVLLVDELTIYMRQGR